MTFQADLASLISHYFEALERFDLEAAADCFSGDVFYSHPAYSHESRKGTRHEVRGREALIELFKARGPRPTQHRVDRALSEGDHGFVEGAFISGDTRGSFVSTVTLDADGRISSYAAYSSIPPVGSQSSQE